MQIEESDEHCKKAEGSIHESREPGSNVTLERDLQPKKQLLQSFSTEAGMEIEESDAHVEKPKASIDES
jgi:hypothetical protein